MATNIKNNSNMCIGCPGHCCRLQASLTSYDIARIVILEEKNAPDFVGAIIAGDNDQMAFRAEGKRNKLVLRQKPNNDCVFLNTKKKLMCEIENSKPAICLAYPLFIWSKGEPRLCSKVVCPKQNLDLIDLDKMSTEALQDCAWEMEQYYSMVKDWNSFAKGDERIEDFMIFAFRETDLESSRFGSLYRKLKRPLLPYVRL